MQGLQTHNRPRLRHWYYDAQALRQVDLVPTLVESLCEEFRLDLPRPRLYMVFSELISNALDHGVLKLNSLLKDGPNGFEAFMALRQERLASLRDGFVDVAVEGNLSLIHI